MRSNVVRMLLCIIAAAMIGIFTCISDESNTTNPPNSADVQSIIICHKAAYPSSSDTYRFINNCYGKWLTPKYTVFLNTDSTVNILIGEEIIHTGQFSIEYIDGDYYLRCHCDDIEGKISVCQNKLYNTQANEIWKFECKCGI